MLKRVQVDFNQLNMIGDDNLTDVVYFNPHVETHRALLAAIQEGQRVMLYQDEGDFEVEGVVARSPHSDTWYARPDWTTFRDLSIGSDH